MTISEIERYARLKGLSLMGTGDFTHPKWIAEIKEHLEEVDGTGLYGLRIDPSSPIRFMITGEVSTIFVYEKKVRKIHHVVFTPNLEVAEQINERLAKFGNLSIDGRPVFNATAPEITEAIMEVSSKNVVIPAHAWTPWFSLFGAFSGFDRIEDCYKDQTRHIFAIETGLSCYDEKTEVLTVDGWKKFSEIRYSDEICTLNIETNTIEFQNPLGIFSYRYRGKMYRLKTKRVDLLVTPNHRLLVSGCDFRKPPRFFLREARFLFNKSKRVKKGGIWIGKNDEYFILPAVEIRHRNRYYSGLRKKTKKYLPMHDWLKFFGFWLAEGWTGEGKNGDYNVCVANKNLNLLSEIKRILECFGYTVQQTGNIIRVRDFQLFSHLKQFGKSQDKFVPREIKSLSKELLEILLEYYLKGDGHVYGRAGKGLSATTSSIRLREDLQEIALKVGMSAYYKLGREKGTQITSSHPSFKGYEHKHDSWKVYFVRKNIHTILPSTIKKYGHTEDWVDFDGLVFCVSVPNQVIYVRRNGIPVWCGNSDPPMNWRLSTLDKYALVSNSDSHSAWPWRIGREANVFELDNLTYEELIDAIRRKDSRRFKRTIEVPPALGKYHFSGHRLHKVSFSTKEAKALGDICPVCHRPLTKGVEERVEELADRPYGYRPEGAIDFVHLTPLHEIIAKVTRTVSLSTRKVWEAYNALIAKFGDEFTVLTSAPLDEMAKVVGAEIAMAVMGVRQDTVKIRPGYDGIYGEIVSFGVKEKSITKGKRVTLVDFF